jgi:hypothetical protein
MSRKRKEATRYYQFCHKENTHWIGIISFITVTVDKLSVPLGKSLKVITNKFNCLNKSDRKQTHLDRKP